MSVTIANLQAAIKLFQENLRIDYEKLCRQKFVEVDVTAFVDTCRQPRDLAPARIG